MMWKKLANSVAEFVKFAKEIIFLPYLTKYR